jgi:hypothetical protein
MHKTHWLFLMILLTLALRELRGMSTHNQFDIAAEAWAKFDPALRRALSSTHADPTIMLPVIIVLTASTEPQAMRQEGPRSREARTQLAAERQAEFERESAPLIRELERLGAQDIQRFWINRTVSVRLPLPALQAVGQRAEVQQIMLIVPQKVLATPTGPKGE